MSNSQLFNRDRMIEYLSQNRIDSSKVEDVFNEESYPKLLPQIAGFIVIQSLIIPSTGASVILHMNQTARVNPMLSHWLICHGWETMSMWIHGQCFALLRPAFDGGLPVAKLFPIQPQTV